MAMEPNYAPYVPAANALWSRSKFRSAILAVRLTSLCPVARPVG